MTPADVDAVWTTMLANPGEMALWMVITVVAGFLVCSFGLQKGLERISKWMMICLLVLIVILAINSLTLEGAIEGVKFYLVPDFERAAEVGIGNVIVAAMNQSFFTLSLGIAAMEIFGSYMSDANRLPGEAVRICCLDTFVAFMSGMIIFPACFSFGIEADSGPNLIFLTLPRVFVSMTGGRLWGALFFLFLTFASFTTVLAVFENIMASCMDNFGWSRKKATIACGVFILLASFPCVLGFNVWSSFSVPLPNGATGRCHGHRGLPGQQPAAAHRLPDLPAVLRQQVGLGLRQLPGGGQQGLRPGDVPQAAALLPVHPAPADPGDPAGRPGQLVLAHSGLRPGGAVRLVHGPAQRQDRQLNPVSFSSEDRQMTVLASHFRKLSPVPPVSDHFLVNSSEFAGRGAFSCKTAFQARRFMVY